MKLKSACCQYSQECGGLELCPCKLTSLPRYQAKLAGTTLKQTAIYVWKYTDGLQCHDSCLSAHSSTPAVAATYVKSSVWLLSLMQQLLYTLILILRTCFSLATCNVLWCCRRKQRLSRLHPSCPWARCKWWSCVLRDWRVCRYM